MNTSTLALAFMALVASPAIAQKTTSPAPKKVEKKEIIIEEKTGDKKEKLEVVIDGDKVTINGKPADQYKGQKHIVIDDDIVINGDRVRVPQKRSVTVRSTGTSRAMLGVVTEKSDKGAKVTEVMEETAAKKAGLVAGDVITSVNGKTVSDAETLAGTIRGFKPGDVVDIAYLHDGKEKKVKATLGKSEAPMAFTWNGNGEFPGEMFDKNFEFRMEPPMAMTMPPGQHFKFDNNDMMFYRSEKPKYGMGVEDNSEGEGVKVSRVDSASNAAKGGLLENDIITGINGKAIKNVDELRAELAASGEKPSVELQVMRSGKQQTVTVRVPKRIKSADL